MRKLIRVEFVIKTGESMIHAEVESIQSFTQVRFPNFQFYPRKTRKLTFLAKNWKWKMFKTCSMYVTHLLWTWTYCQFLCNYHLKYKLNQFVVPLVTNSMYGFKFLNLEKLRMIQVVIGFAFSDPWKRSGRQWDSPLEERDAS